MGFCAYFKKNFMIFWDRKTFSKTSSKCDEIQEMCLTVKSKVLGIREYEDY